MTETGMDFIERLLLGCNEAFSILQFVNPQPDLRQVHLTSVYPLEYGGFGFPQVRLSDHYYLLVCVAYPWTQSDSSGVLR